MAEFEALSVAEALEASIAAATHLQPKDAAVVAAARALARKIDAWDVIVEWALEDAAEDQSRPKVPANDNVSLASFMKYLAELRLVPDKTGAPSSPAQPVNEIEEMRRRLSRA